MINPAPPATKQITVTIKTMIGQSWDDNVNPGDTVGKVIDEAVAHFGMTLETGITAQAVLGNKMLSRQSTLADAGVQDKTTLLLEVGPLMSNVVMASICVYLVAFAVVGLYMLFEIWPKTVITMPGNVTSFDYDHPFGLTSNPELILLLVVIFSGVLGAFVQSMASLVQHKSQSDLGARWAAWYASRPPLAIGLALLVYFLIRGGLLTLGNVNLGTDPTRISVFAVAAVSAIAGMFTDEATKRLGKVVDTLFGVEEGRGTS